MQRTYGRRHHSKETLIRLLSADDRNFIATYWSGVCPADGCFTAGINLVTHEPYYAGWGGSLEEKSQLISAAELEMVKEMCDATPWGQEFGGKCLGGTEYRLKPEMRVAQ